MERQGRDKMSDKNCKNCGNEIPNASQVRAICFECGRYKGHVPIKVTKVDHWQPARAEPVNPEGKRN